MRLPDADSVRIEKLRDDRERLRKQRNDLRRQLPLGTGLRRRRRQHLRYEELRTDDECRLPHAGRWPETVRVRVGRLLGRHAVCLLRWQTVRERDVHVTPLRRAIAGSAGSSYDSGVRQPRRRLVASTIAVYTAICGLLFVALHAWKGGPNGSRWSGASWAPVEASTAHHFFPQSALDFAVALGVLALASFALVLVRGRQALRPMAVAWSGASALLGVLILAIPHLQVLALEPGSYAVGHVLPPIVAAFLLPIGLALALMAVVERSTWSPMLWAGVTGMALAMGIYSEMQRQRVPTSMQCSAAVEALVFIVAALCGVLTTALLLKKRSRTEATS